MRIIIIFLVILTTTTTAALAADDPEVSIFNMDMGNASVPSANTEEDQIRELVASQKQAVSSLPESGRMVLTFDDGYSGIKRILDSLRKEKVICTFFVIGSRLVANSDLWRQAVSDGHEIAYHTMDHSSLLSKSDEWIKEDILAWEKTARGVLGESYLIPKVARLPGGNGHKSERVLKVFNDLGYIVVGWSEDTLSGVKSREPEKIASFVLRKSKAGVIMLQHFDLEDSASVRLFLHSLKERANKKGFILGGRLSDALQEAGYWKER